MEDPKDILSFSLSIPHRALAHDYRRRKSNRLVRDRRGCKCSYMEKISVKQQMKMLKVSKDLVIVIKSKGFSEWFID